MPEAPPPSSPPCLIVDVDGVLADFLGALWHQARTVIKNGWLEQSIELQAIADQTTIERILPGT